jgi:hypothetical protein
MKTGKFSKTSANQFITISCRRPRDENKIYYLYFSVFYIRLGTAARNCNRKVELRDLFNVRQCIYAYCYT